MSKSSSVGKSSFGQTIHFITDIKLAELEKQRLAYQAHAKVLDESSALAAKGDIVAQVKTLAKAVESWTGSGAVGRLDVIGGKLQLSDLDFWLQQAEKDPGFNLDVARGWARTLEEHIRHNTMRFDAAKLFGVLFNEWMSSGDSSALVYQAGTEDAASDLDAMSFEHVDVGRKEMRDEREKLESIIFEEYPVDIEKLSDYLEGLFSSEEAAKELETLRISMSEFGYGLQKTVISTSDVTNAIQGLLASGLMDEEKRDTLKAFEENATIMKELASVLNMRMRNLSSWAWPKEPMVVEFRRHLHGKYRGFTDPEIIDALLLHHIAVAWQVQMKVVLRRVFDSKAWVRPAPPTAATMERWNAQLQEGNGFYSIDAERNTTRRANFFLSRLQEQASVPSRYDDLVDAPEVAESTGKEAASPATIKRKLLHVMTTECHFNLALHGGHSIIRSDMEWFGPSLPHATIFTVLGFLGIPSLWIDFFQAFLSTPLRFPGDTGSRIRKRGTPIAYALSVVCGEAVLFIMDFAVNQRARGLHLYRMHDDLWLWDSDPKKVADGWAEMNTYAGIAGLRFNRKKTGSAFVGTRTEDHARLPEGDIRWGFLKFDPEESRFIIDQTDVDRHITEMRRQLASSKSVFGWINAYNKYMASFLRNFGGIPANCFNEAHINDLIETMGRIQVELFPKTKDTGAGAIGYLKGIVGERFGIEGLPDGYFYFPIARGGLELRNVVVEILALEKYGRPLASTKQAAAGAKDAYTNSDWTAVGSNDGWEPSSFTKARGISTAPEEEFVKQAEHDRTAYEAAKNVWDSVHPVSAIRRPDARFGPAKDEFMSFEEFTSLRESWLYRWGAAYRDMLCSPLPRRITLLPKIREAMQGDNCTSRWEKMDWYEKWVLSMYGGDIVASFGGLEAVDHDLIPIGMVELFRTSRMNLDQ